MGDNAKIANSALIHAAKYSKMDAGFLLVPSSMRALLGQAHKGEI
jgi:hypothetical protein